MAAILEEKNKEKMALFVDQKNPEEVCYILNNPFCFEESMCVLVTWVKHYL